MLSADDPLIFKDGFTETWRNGDPEGCVMTSDDLMTSDDVMTSDGDGHGGLEDSSLGTAGLNASSLTLIYEWE